LHQPLPPWRVEAVLQAEAAQLPLVPVMLLAVLLAAVLLTSLFSKSAGCGPSLLGHPVVGGPSAAGSVVVQQEADCQEDSPEA